MSMELLSDLGQCPYRVFNSSAGVARCALQVDIRTPILASPSVAVTSNLLDCFGALMGPACILIE